MRACPVLCLLLLGQATTALAAADEIEEIVVRSTRLEQTEAMAPIAISVVGEEDIQLARQQLGIDEALNRVPGVFFQNRYNFHQDLRISIRGFGAQAQFGINGIRIAVDGIPVTTPDGTAQVDDLDMGSMGRIEVVRGPAAALYGTSAGGAINIYTEAPPETPFVEGRVMAGAFDTRKYQLKTGGHAGKLGYIGSVHHVDVDGFRDFAESEATVFNTKLTYDVDPTLRVTTVAAGVHSPLARDPGALTRAELATGPRDQARALNVRCNVREVVDQYRGGVVVTKSIGESHQLRARGYGLTRDFDTNLPCPFVGHTAFERVFVGGGGEYAWSGTLLGRPMQVITGFEVTSQEDDRLSWASDDEGQRGALSEDQLEAVDTVALYLLNQWTLRDSVLLSVSARWESLDFRLDDHFLSNGDNSGEVTFEELTPMAGITVSLRRWLNVYANVATSFETPTLSQLGDPEGPGINEDVDAQTSTNYELGMKGVLGDRLRYSVAVFSIDLEDQLVPFELNDDVFYRNAGESSRNGLELSTRWQLTPRLTATLAYTLNDFEFDAFEVNGTVLSGNETPGIPKNQLFAELAYAHPAGWYGIWDVLHVGRMFADNANSPAARVDDYRVSNLRFGRRFGWDGVEANAFLGINNLFDEEYFSNVRINQSSNRFFEPAPDRHAYGGVSVRFDLGG